MVTFGQTKDKDQESFPMKTDPVLKATGEMTFASNNQCFISKIAWLIDRDDYSRKDINK